MNIAQWCGKYADLDFNNETALTCVEEFKDIVDGKSLILYGAKIIGESMCNLLHEMGLSVCSFVDKNYDKIRELCGVIVNKPEWLKTIDTEKSCIFAMVDPYNLSEVISYIDSLKINYSELSDGHSAHSVLQTAWCTIKNKQNIPIDPRMCMNCSVMKLTCKALKLYLMRIMDFDVETATGTDTQKSIGYSLAGICTLKCKDCHEMTPYAKPSRREYTPKDVYFSDMKKVLESCKFVTTLEFVGGEPFAHPELEDILRETIKYPNLGLIHIFSNGTVIPNNDVCRLLSNPRIAVTLTNFAEQLSLKQREIFERVKKKMKESNVQYIVRFLTTWTESNSFEFVDDNVEKLKKRFSECRFSSCRRLAYGIMYACQHDYAGELTGLFPLIDNQVKVHDFSAEELAEALEEFNNREYFNICNYCQLPDKTKAIPAAIQLQ